MLIPFHRGHSLERLEEARREWKRVEEGNRDFERVALFSTLVNLMAFSDHINTNNFKVGLG